MNDMNFFAPLQVAHNKRKSGSVTTFLLVFLIILLVIAPVGGFAYEWFLNSQIITAQATLNAPENQSTLAKLDALQSQLDTITQSIPELQKKDSLLMKTEWVTEQTLQVIVDTIPKQISANIVSLNERSVQIDGVSADKPAIAEMEYNLRKSDVADSIIVSHITKAEDGSYSYAINFTVKDVKTQ